jgi:hypothetical protein
MLYVGVLFAELSERIHIESPIEVKQFEYPCTLAGAAADAYPITTSLLRKTSWAFAVSECEITAMVAITRPTLPALLRTSLEKPKNIEPLSSPVPNFETVQ